MLVLTVVTIMDSVLMVIVVVEKGGEANTVMNKIVQIVVQIMENVQDSLTLYVFAIQPLLEKTVRLLNALEDVMFINTVMQAQ